MLLLRRRLNEVTYIGAALEPDDMDGTYDQKVRVTRIVDAFEAPRVTVEITDRNGYIEIAQFTPQYPVLDVGEGKIKLCAIQAVRERSGSVEPFVSIGFDYPSDIHIVRDNARNKT